MERVRYNGLVYYHFKSVSQLGGVTHGVFTRRGGVSLPPYDSLNVGSTVGDDPDRVRVNHERIAGVIGAEDTSFRTTWQVHGAEVLVARRDQAQSWPPPQADGIITAENDLPLIMRYADCVPIMLVDPVRHVIGMAHAGWRGTLAGIGPATIRAMHEVYGSQPQDIVAGIGPSIGPCCYEVGPEVIAQMREVFPEADDLIVPPNNGRGAYLDLWKATEYALRSAGVQFVEVARLCTRCHSHEFYSHRAEAGRTGRFGAILMMTNGKG